MVRRVAPAARLVGLLALVLLLLGCSPEASRTRGLPGADVGNRAPSVDVHGPVDPFYLTPREGQAILR